MVSSISGGSNSGSIQQLMVQLLKKLQSVEDGGTKYMSGNEQSSVNTNSNKGGTNFLDTISKNFDKIDTDGDGKLSLDEIKSAANPPKEPMGLPPRLMNALSSADTDGVSGLSKDELASINTNHHRGRAHFIKNLTNNFDKFDTNQDGQLSMDEIAASRVQNPVGQTQQQTGCCCNCNEDSTTSTPASSTNSSANISNNLNTLANLSEFFIQQLIEGYKTNTPTVTSPLNGTF